MSVAFISAGAGSLALDPPPTTRHFIPEDPGSWGIKFELLATPKFELAWGNHRRRCKYKTGSLYNIHDSWRLYPRNTMDRRKIEYNGKDNIRGISPLPEDTKDDGKHLKKLLVVSFHVQLAVWIP